MPSPRPGRAVRGSTTRRPVMALLDLLGRRWALRVMWELAQEPAGFRALQGRCDGMSPSVLARRLADLREAGIVSADEAAVYGVTPEGRRLCALLAPLDAWARRWASRGGTAAGPAGRRARGAGGSGVGRSRGAGGGGGRGSRASTGSRSRRGRPGTRASHQ